MDAGVRPENCPYRELRNEDSSSSVTLAPSQKSRLEGVIRLGHHHLIQPIGKPYHRSLVVGIASMAHQGTSLDSRRNEVMVRLLEIHHNLPGRGHCLLRL